jgi:GT2 family glycosyltransferase/glycosyltransferase involved in cell wall biosynthesis
MLPHPDRHGADLQWMQMLQELRAQGHEVTHVARSAVNRDRYTAPLEQLGIRVLTPDAERLRFLGFDFPATWTFEQLLKETKFDLAILFHWFWNGISIPEHYMEDIRRLSPETFIAVLTDDQQGLREMQLANLTHYWADCERSGDFASREMEVYRRADVVLTISEDDRRAFLRAEPSLRTGAMPMIATAGPEGLPFQSRSDVLFLANFDNPANRDAVDWMLADIWPRVRKPLPSVNLALVGNNLPAGLGLDQQGVRRIGYVADLTPIFSAARVAASPVRFGTGIKTKNLLALAHGVPLVTTTVGADGLNLRDGLSALIVDSAEEFSSAVARAYGDENLWNGLSRQGRARIVEDFSAQRMREAVQNVIERARTLQPKSFEPAYRWSYRIVEERYPEVLTAEPAPNRNDLRIAKYLILAEEFLAEQRTAEALAQLRHGSSMLRRKIPATGMNLHKVELMARCYRDLGDPARAADYEKLVVRHLGERAVSKNGSLKLKSCDRQKSPRPFFSVIIPTYNRQTVLLQCLEALEKQSIAKEEFEVIVVDDGSTDSTETFCRNYRPSHAFRYMRQLNAGAGAARRRAVQHAGGEFLLLINDDTIADPNLLAIHREAQNSANHERQAILGNFQFPDSAADHALSRFLRSSPFFFPQATLQPGKHWEYTYFVTCNLSILREAVLDAGSFDAQFRVAEDSDLGLRLSRKGFWVNYIPEARAIHQHLPFTVRDLIHRAEIYGRTQLALLRKHPALLGDGGSLFGMLDEAAAETWRGLIRNRGKDVEAMVKQMEKIDALDFAPFSIMPAGERTAAEEITKLFRRAVPDVYWFYFLSSLLAAWNQETAHPSMRALQLDMDAEEPYI